jgi:enhanced entry protein EnhC
MKLQSRLLPWFCLVTAANVGSAFADNGLDAYRQGHYIQAAEQLNTETNKDAVVDYYIARMRLYGYGQLKNNISAMHAFQRAAEKGYLPAQRTMALYELTMQSNPEQALYWFKKAADANDLQAQMYCAAAYTVGLGTKKNSDAAKRYYIAAAKSGDSLAQYALAENFLDARQAESKKLGLIWLTKAVEKNNPAAQLKLGELYASGTLVKQDLEKAKELMNLSIAQGYFPAIYKMGELAQKQNNIIEAKEWYTKAAMAHYVPAEYALAQLYLQDKGQLYNPHLAFLWMLKSAQAGDAQAQLALANMYKTGQGIEPNEALAKEWQQKAAVPVKDNLALAQTRAALWLSMGKSNQLAAMGYHMRGIFNDWFNADALKENNYNQPPQMDVVTREMLYKPKFVMTNPNDIAISEYYDALASVLGDARQNNMDFSHYPLDMKAIRAEFKQSDGQAQAATDYKADFERLQSRATLGDSTAQFALAQMYQDGLGTTKNMSEAIKYYEAASAQQDLRAEYNLALIYLEGQGVPADYEKAINLLRDAAFKGNDLAQYALGRIYELGYHDASGEVVKPDPDQAMAMYELAAVDDFGPAQYHLAEMMVRDKKADISVASKERRNKLLKELYEGAFAYGVADAALPLAYFNAMESDPSKQSSAFEMAKKEANAGKAGAALLVGLMYDRGIGVALNQDEAIDWYEKAPTNPIASFILGTYYSQGLGVSKDAEKGKASLQQAAEAGFSYANLNLAVMKQQLGEPFLPDLDKASSMGNSKAGLLLADYYLSRANDAQQMQQARDIYQHFADKGDKDAQLKLGFMYEQGLGGVPDIASAEKWYGASANQGQPIAQYLLGHLYQLGRIGQQPDYALAKKWYSSAQSSYAPAAVALGFVNDTVDDNYEEAHASYQVASAQNDPNGQFNLGLIYEKGKGRAVDYVKAKELYEKAAEKGHRQAMVQLAGLYFNGLGESRDEDEALTWYQKAAALGDRDALYQLGLLYETGVALKLDFAEALKYYQQAADKGNAKAKLALARIYQYGLGVAKDSQQAIKYYKELAALGNAYAQYQLATFYYEGVDGKRMPQEGKQLLLLAQENGSQQARRLLQWLNAQTQDHKGSYIEPIAINQSPTLGEEPAELMYLNALNEWNRGDEGTSKLILNRLMMQFPDYVPAKRAYEQLNHPAIAPESIFG